MTLMIGTSRTYVNLNILLLLEMTKFLHSCRILSLFRPQTVFFKSLWTLVHVLLSMCAFLMHYKLVDRSLVQANVAQLSHICSPHLIGRGYEELTIVFCFCELFFLATFVKQICQKKKIHSLIYRRQYHRSSNVL